MFIIFLLVRYDINYKLLTLKSIFAFIYLSAMSSTVVDLRKKKKPSRGQQSNIGIFLFPSHIKISYIKM
ncbi:MAG TPA: hypothetical protein DCQ28_00535 [Bacteroidetes bacterium]|nr:hypothetical protein [Bacteroidota bacterium]